jgi:hypothetical protein
MTNTLALDFPQDQLGGSLSTPLGTQDIPHSMPVSPPAATEPVAGAVTAPEPDRAGRSTVAWIAALVVVTAALGLFAWLR